MNLVHFTGNCPRSVSKDAKYSVRYGDGRPVISLIYETSEGEKYYLATADHAPLVEMVNTIKETAGDRSMGPFYINEYRQVIVPVGQSADYYYAGEYLDDLEFDFKGKILSGRPVTGRGKALRPGEEWLGPHAGIPYILCAGGNDIKYVARTGRNSRKDVKLSQAQSGQRAREIAHRLREFKGHEGGRFYVNEWRAMFTPLKERDEYRYIYIGQLTEDDPWFLKPAVGV